MSRQTRVSEKVLWRFRSVVLARGDLSNFEGRGPLSIVGLFRTASGIGQAARACAEGFEAAGVPVHRVDLSEAFGQVDQPPDPRLASRPLPGGTLIVNLNAPETERALFLCGNWRGTKRRVIGCWVWEMPTPPLDWAPATELLSEIWVPSQFTYSALVSLTNKPMRVVPHYIAPCPPSPAISKERGLRVITFADGKSSFTRKNVLAAVEAFVTSGLDASSELVLKTRNIDHSPTVGSLLKEVAGRDPRIRIVNGSLSRTEVMRLIDDSDVLLSLHRAEGFGLTIAEAMLREKPVIATGWSGNVDFMDNDSAVMVPHRLTQVDDPCGVYRAQPGAVWAEPDIRYAADALGKLATNPDWRRAIGQAARRKVLPLTTGKAYREALEGVN